MPASDLTITQAMERLNVRESSVRRLCIAGMLPGAYKTGRQWRIPPRAVERYIAEHQTEGLSEETEYLLSTLTRDNVELLIRLHDDPKHRVTFVRLGEQLGMTKQAANLAYVTAKAKRASNRVARRRQSQEAEALAS